MFRIGGAQAIAALAFGTATIPKVDRIVGPGNIYVTAAKKLLAGEVGIDFIAGPTEIVIIAEDADPQHLAADMLAQAEHDVEASSILLTTSRKLAEQVAQEVARQLETLPTAPVACQSIRNHSAVILCPSIDAAVDASNRLAPEHLAIYDDALLPKIQHAGSIFLGPSSPEAAGDYASGPNHVLPTVGCRPDSRWTLASRLREDHLRPGADCRRSQPPCARHHDARARRRPGSARPLGGGPACQVEKWICRRASCSRAKRSSRWRLIRRPPPAVPDKLRLDFNENTVGASPKVIEYLREHLTADGLAVYPEYGEIKHELAEFFGVEPDDFILTNGTDEAIQVLINTYVDDDDEVLLLQPSYAMYRFYAEVAGARFEPDPVSAREAGISARRTACRRFVQPRAPS